MIDPPYELWIEVFGSKPPSVANKSFQQNTIEEILKLSFISYWEDCTWETRHLSSQEWLEVKNRLGIARKGYSIRLLKLLLPSEDIIDLSHLDITCGKTNFLPLH